MSKTRHVGRLEIQPERRQVLQDGLPVSLGARAFDVLHTLFERSGRVVSRAELLDTVWPDLPVEDNNLTVQIGAIRKALGSDVVATVPGRGYRFTAAGSAGDETHAGSAVPRKLRTNLARTPHSLIGRDAELAELGATLAEHRLVTITGPGGVGKTRLAQRLLQDREDAFTHGVGWVELAALHDAASLPGAIAASLGLQIDGGDPLERLVAASSPLQMIVGLDNAEHLSDSVAGVVQALMRHAPDVRFLVTSQTPLHVEGERVFRMSPLAIPSLDATAQVALAHGAVALFVERARAADRSFAVDDLNLPSIVSVCSQLTVCPSRSSWQLHVCRTSARRPSRTC